MQNQKQLQHALRDQIIALNPQIMVTFNYKRRVTFDQMENQVRHFANVVQDKVLGRRWNCFSAPERLAFIGVAEHLDTNPHVHAAVNGQASLLDFLQSEEAEMRWRRIHERCGQLHVGTKSNPPAIAAYMTKELYRANSLDRAIFYGRGQPTPDAPTNR